VNFEHRPGTVTHFKSTQIGSVRLVNCDDTCKLWLNNFISAVFKFYC